MSETLKPCPFCGSYNLAESYHSPFVICDDCGAFGPGNADMTHDEAVKAWNMRTPEQAILVTLGSKKAKAHPYGYERDTGAYDRTRCECGCINDISATYCNDCGGEIEIDESAEKEYYDGCGKHTVFATKHDDGSLEFGEKRYIVETLGGGECEVVQGDNGLKCSNCGKELPEDPYSDYEGNFCPTCGARVRKAVER